MPRIRTIKPEFWDSPGIETLDPRWRLLYIAMWNWADDSGRGKGEARELMGFAFPRDEEMTLGEFRRGLGEVRRVFGVMFYRVDGRSFFQIPSWDRHQKIDKRSSTRWPDPEEGEPFDPATNALVSNGVCGESAGSPESPPSVQRDSGAGTGEQGNRGTGEKNTLAHPSGASDRFDAFWSAYPRKVGKQKARQKFQTAARRASADVVVAGAQRLAADPNLPESQFIPHPSTWLERGGWEDEPLPPRNVRPLNRAQERLNQNMSVVQHFMDEQRGIES